MGITLFRKNLLYGAFVLSGFCALVYEVLWTKYLSLIFGNTIFAVSLVAATFMAGLALGSYLVGRVVDRDFNLLRIYGFLEIGIAVTAILFVPTLNIVEHLYVYWSQKLSAVSLLVTVIHFLFAGALLLPPAVCMGGTFPLMCRFFARRKSGGQIGRLYALNTLGAMLGAFCAGFVLIPQFGLSKTAYLAVSGNLVVAAIALYLAKRRGKIDAEGQSAVEPKSLFVAVKHRRILVSVGLIGFFSLAYEILWTRVFLLFLGNTSYAFSLMLSAYLGGITLGGFLYSRMVHPGINEKRLFVILSTLMGLVILATSPFYDQLAYLFQFAHQLSGERWWLLSFFSFLSVFLVMSVPTIISGALLPAAVAIVNPGKGRTGEGVGLVVLHNTVGAVLGSLVAGFLLVPAVGLLDSFRVLAIANLVLAGYLAFYYRPEVASRRTVPALLAITIILAVVPFQWNDHLVNSGVYCYATKYSMMGGLDEVLSKEKILEVIEGADSTVAVHESLDGKQRFFSVNGKTDGGTGSDMATQILIGQLPLLMHPAPEDVMVIGLGTGISLKGMSAHPTRGIDCVEISPEVVKAERYFVEANGHALNSPKVKLTINDGRNQLMVRPKSYDVIVSEPSNPWQSGNANLFTDDFYQLAASRLKQGGIFCQWVGLYDITLDNLKIVCRTFLKTFPRALVFRAGPDLIMVGSEEPLSFDLQQLEQRFANHNIAKVMQSIGVNSPGDLLAINYLFAEDLLEDFCEGSRLNTDDHPVLEYSAHANLGEKSLGEHQEQNLAALSEVQGRKLYLPMRNLGDSPDEVASNLREIGSSFLRQGKRGVGASFMRQAEVAIRKQSTF